MLAFGTMVFVTFHQEIPTLGMTEVVDGRFFCLGWAIVDTRSEGAMPHPYGLAAFGVPGMNFPTKNRPDTVVSGRSM